MIRMYTDAENKDYVYLNIESLFHAYKYAVSVKNKEAANLLKKMYSEGTEHSRIEKTSNLYAFLITCPNTILDEIDWEKIIYAYSIARLKNNKPVLQKLGTILGHWKQYTLDGKEMEGLITEIAKLPSEIRNFVIANQNIEEYQNQVREQSKNIKPAVSETQTNASFVEFRDYEKTLKKAA